MANIQVYRQPGTCIYRCSPDVYEYLLKRDNGTAFSIEEYRFINNYKYLSPGAIKNTLGYWNFDPETLLCARWGAAALGRTEIVAIIDKEIVRNLDWTPVSLPSD